MKKYGLLLIFLVSSNAFAQKGRVGPLVQEGSPVTAVPIFDDRARVKCQEIVVFEGSQACSIGWTPVLNEATGVLERRHVLLTSKDGELLEQLLLLNEKIKEGDKEVVAKLDRILGVMSGGKDHEAGVGLLPVIIDIRELLRNGGGGFPALPASAPPAKTKWYETGAFWTTIAVVVVGSVLTGVIVGTRNKTLDGPAHDQPNSGIWVPGQQALGTW